jgi:hypothetical protein
MSLEIRVNLTSSQKQFTLLGFEALYAAPDGCLCTNGTSQIVINDKPVTTAGNYFEFAKPFPIFDGTADIKYSRQVRPPLMEQVPVDCEFGDIRIRIKASWHDNPRGFERFFRFGDDGNLTEISAIREPPILSDTILRKAHSKGLITREEIDRAQLVDATARYQIVNFGDLIKQVYSRASGRLDVTQDYRIFLMDLHRRTLDRSMLEEFYDS